MNEKITDSSFKDTLVKLEAIPLNDQVFNEIRRAIISGVVAPGARLVISELASSFGTSLTPVKEAVAKLEAEGLVTVTPRVGTFVSSLEYDEVKELFEVRLMIELYAAEKNVELITESQIQNLNRLVSELASHVDGNHYTNFSEYIEKEYYFHQHFVELCGNRRLLSIYRKLDAHLMITRAYYLKRVEGAVQATKEHQTIVQYLEEGDLESLQKLLRDHVSHGMTNVLQAMKVIAKDI
jgi:DNA-binding GntR family transcriptional regulator